MEVQTLIGSQAWVTLANHTGAIPHLDTSVAHKRSRFGEERAVMNVVYNVYQDW